MNYMREAKLSKVADRIALLQRREAVTAAMVRGIDNKLARLATAKDERIIALNNIRSEIARQSAAQYAPEIYEHTPAHK